MHTTCVLKPSAREALARELRDLQGYDDEAAEGDSYPERQVQEPADSREWARKAAGGVRP